MAIGSARACSVPEALALDSMTIRKRLHGQEREEQPRDPGKSGRILTARPNSFKRLLIDPISPVGPRRARVHRCLPYMAVGIAAGHELQYLSDRYGEVGSGEWTTTENIEGEEGGRDARGR